MNNIKWNEYTWYSRLAAFIFFIAILPAWTFYIGIQYQETKNALQPNVESIPLKIGRPCSPEICSTSSKSIISNSELVGIWQQSPVMAAGWSNRYQFFPSGKYNYSRSEMNTAERALGHSGRYGVTGDELILNPTYRIDIVGGTIVKDSLFGEVIEGGSETQTQFTKTIVYPITKCQNPEVTHYECISINNTYFYKFGDDPAKYGDGKDGLRAEPSN